MIKNIVRKIVVLAASLAAGAAFFVSYGFAAGSGNPNNHISFINLSVNDGLSQCTVLSCVQDTLGRMWFATQDGLNLYDGYEFRTFRNDAQDSTSVANNIIRKVYLDKSGNIWVGTGKGLSWYDARSESFRNFATDDRAVTGIGSHSGFGPGFYWGAGPGVRFGFRNNIGLSLQPAVKMVIGVPYLFDLSINVAVDF